MLMYGHGPVSPGCVLAEFRRMRASPTGLQRPVLILSGWHTPPGLAWLLTRRLAPLVGAPRSSFLGISYMLRGRMAGLVKKVNRRAFRRWQGREVDVIGVSLGGLVARAAAIPWPEANLPALRVARLFSVCAPHRGAKLAEHFAFEDSVRKMRAGSDFLRMLDEALPGATYDIIPYARTRDVFVGATRAAPPGRQPIWFESNLVSAHHLASFDARIQIDIARRLRGEPSAAPLPSAPPRD